MQSLDLKVIDYWGPVCETGRHWPPHPGMTCDEADAWIRHRDEILAEYVRAGWDRLEREFRDAPIAGTVFAPPADEPATDLPDHRSVQQALDILRPHLAWQPHYRP